MKLGPKFNPFRSSTKSMDHVSKSSRDSDPKTPKTDQKVNDVATKKRIWDVKKLDPNSKDGATHKLFERVSEEIPVKAESTAEKVSEQLTGRKSRGSQDQPTKTEEKVSKRGTWVIAKSNSNPKIVTTKLSEGRLSREIPEKAKPTAKKVSVKLPESKPSPGSDLEEINSESPFAKRRAVLMKGTKKQTAQSKPKTSKKLSKSFRRSSSDKIQSPSSSKKEAPDLDVVLSNMTHNIDNDLENFSKDMMTLSKNQKEEVANKILKKLINDPHRLRKLIRGTALAELKKEIHEGHFLRDTTVCGELFKGMILKNTQGSLDECLEFAKGEIEKIELNPNDPKEILNKDQVKESLNDIIDVYQKFINNKVDSELKEVFEFISTIAGLKFEGKEGGKHALSILFLRVVNPSLANSTSELEIGDSKRTKYMIVSRLLQSFVNGVGPRGDDINFIKISKDYPKKRETMMESLSGGDNPLTIDTAYNNPLIFDAMMEVAKKNYQEENFEFIKAVKELKDGDIEQANKILEDFIENDTLNINSEIKQAAVSVKGTDALIKALRNTLEALEAGMDPVWMDITNKFRASVLEGS